MGVLKEFERVVQPVLHERDWATVTVAPPDGDARTFEVRQGDGGKLEANNVARSDLGGMLVGVLSIVVRVPVGDKARVYGFMWAPGEVAPQRLSPKVNRHCHNTDCSTGAYIGNEPGVEYC